MTGGASDVNLVAVKRSAEYSVLRAPHCPLHANIDFTKHPTSSSLFPCCRYRCPFTRFYAGVRKVVMRPTLSSTFIFFLLTLFNGISNAYVTLYNWPTVAYTGKTYTISWSGDGTPVTVSLLVGGSSTTLTNLGAIYTGTSSSIYWTVGTALKASNYYVIKISQSGYTDYSDYFTLLESTSGTTPTSASTIKGTSLSSAKSVYTSISTQISSVPTTVTKVSTVTPTSASSDDSLFINSPTSSSDNALFTSDDSSISSLYPTPLSTVSISMASFSTFTPSSCASSTTTDLSSSSSSDCQGSHLSHTTIIGIIVGAIIAVIAILGGVILVIRRSMNKHDAVRIQEKADILSPGPTPGPVASEPNPCPTPSAIGAYASVPNQQQQQHSPGPNAHDQQYFNQDKPQQYQQSYQPYQHQQTYQPPYQQYQYQPYQQQQQPYPPQQYPLPMESHELTAMQDIKRPEHTTTVHSPTSAISPATTYSNMHTNGPGTSISDRASEMDTTILPRYEKEAPIASVQAIQPGQQQPRDGRPPPPQDQGQGYGHGHGHGHGHGPVYELG